MRDHKSCPFCFTHFAQYVKNCPECGIPMEVTARSVPPRTCLDLPLAKAVGGLEAPDLYLLSPSIC